MPVFEWRSIMPVPADELYAYHARPGAFERLAPPWQRIHVVEQQGGVQDGGRLVFEYGLGPVKRRWAAEVSGHIEGRQFVDHQVHGPFGRWQHTHRFEPIDDHTSELHDRVEYSLPAGQVTDVLGGMPVTGFLRRLFQFRHERTRADLRRHAAWAGESPLTVVIAGAGGVVGSALAPYLTTAGHRVVKLVRRPPTGPDEVQWDPSSGVLAPEALAQADAVVNLSGESLFGLWTAGKRQAIMASRRQATGAIAGALAALGGDGPRSLVSVSAVGAYGSRGGEALTEESARGDDFLAQVCAAWEDAALPAAKAGVRVVHPRFGLVLTPRGGALGAMLPLFKTALGGRIGDGWQWWSWVGIDDDLAALEWLLHDAGVAGPVNVTSPEPVTNREFTETLARVVRRPAWLAAPQAVVERGAGDLGRQMLLASQRALPLRLKQAGFSFEHTRLEDALRFLLGRE